MRANVYADMVAQDTPPEILELERATDPYSNMLPGISSINAARTVGRGVEVGKRGNVPMMIVSAILLLVLILPFILTVVSQVSH